ncbi:BrxE family protein [Verrucomicrobiales bacterium]|nr:BrxE family protein [Verrucomicrobiales bacterium]
MPQSSLKSPAQRLASIRYAVLSDLEKQGYGIDSKSLSEEGQGDLKFIFPRTSILAGITHGGKVASKIFDDRIRDLGFYHLFRLPTFWEGQIHSVLREPDGIFSSESSDPDEILRCITSEEAESSAAVEGAVGLSALDLNSSNDLKKLARAHANAIAAGKLVIPFFSLK